jgi:hypothetical protein
MLLSYALRQNRQPIYVDLDCSEVRLGIAPNKTKEALSGQKNEFMERERLITLAWIFYRAPLQCLDV